MTFSRCKNCEAEFSNQAHLIEHWNRHHKHQNCLRCYATKIGSSDPIFCVTCARDLTRATFTLSKLEKLEKEISRSALRAQRWEFRTQNLLALRETLLEKGDGFSPTLQEFCGHGNRRGQCIPCNPIFERMTTEGWKEAEAKVQARCMAEMHPQPKLKKSKFDDAVEVNIDDD